jgi:hypothetical protein
MQFKAIVFEPGKAGEVKELFMKDLSPLLGGVYEPSANKHGFDDTDVIVNGEGILLELPRNRGYHGTFIVAKYSENEETEGYESLTDEEIQDIKKALDNKSNFVSKNKYLPTFFEEKDLPVRLFMYEIDGNVVNLGNYDVIESILASDDINMLKQSEELIRRIDFANGDVNHFLEHMGQAMADRIVQSHKGFGI